ncbi:MAG: hypothetical protein HOH66_00865 [Rhodospirillaceae bacterium]|jgi:hypothetical protein|nr:hypothetical protein [Rhodospirillaceae bacterium]
MARLLLASLGVLNGMLLEAAARSEAFDEIVVAGRSPDYAARKIANARIGAGVEGRFPTLRFAPFDLNEKGAGHALAEIAPDLTVAAPSLLPWWAVDRLSGRAGEIAHATPFAAFMACHLAPLLAFRERWVESGLEAPWFNLSYPDVVNAVLARTGPAPLCGMGNVIEAIPKIRFVLAEREAVRPETIDVRLVAQHALEYHFYAEPRPEGAPAPDYPPYLIDARIGGRAIAPPDPTALFAPYPIPYDLDFNALTVSAAMVVLAAALGETPTATHVPGPGGRIGGYPVRLSRAGLDLDLAEGWTEAQAIASNESSLPYDGIAAVEGDGTVVFTDETARGLRALLGRPWDRLRPDEAWAMAQALRDAVGA